MRNYLVALAICFSFFSCNTEQQKANRENILSDTSHEAVTPLFGKDHLGQPYIWWIEKSVDKKNILVFASSKDQGASFEKAMSIPVTSGCNDGHGQGMPRLIFKKDGTMLVVYHKKEATEENPYAGKIYYSQSYDQGKTWEAPLLLHQDTLKENSHGFPALTLLPNGEVAAIWLDGRNKLPYSEMFLSRTEGKKGFLKEMKIGGPTCQCCKLDFYADKEQRVHILYRGIMENDIRDIMHMASLDSGKAFSIPSRISEDDWKIKGCPHAGPGMVLHRDSLHYVWFTMGGGDGIFYCRSDKEGKQFSKRENLAKGISKYPQIISLEETKLVLTWQEYDTISLKGQSYNRVKLLFREKDKQRNIYATEEGITATHPSILALNKEEILLAFEKKINDRTVIAYRKVKVE